MKVKEESEKASLKLNIKKKLMSWIWSHHFMANRWGNNGKATDFIFLSFKITEDGDCSHIIKRQLFLGRKAMTNIDSILESRDITLLDKVLSSQSHGFPSGHVWM